MEKKNSECPIRLRWRLVVTDGGWCVTDGGWWVTDGGWWVTDGGWWVTDGGWWVTDGGWWVTDGGWWVTDGGWWVTDGGWWVTDGGWWVTDGGWWVTDGGWWVAAKHQRVDAIVKKKKEKRVSVLMAPPAAKHDTLEGSVTHSDWLAVNSKQRDRKAVLQATVPA